MITKTASYLFHPCNRKIAFLLFIVLMISATQPLFSATHYVKHNATGSNNGTSWTDAYTSLQSALNIAVSGDQIWVAKGTYKPSYAYDLTNTSRYYHFRMKEGVMIFGGFAGTETSVSQRTGFGNDGPNETILSGDIGTLGVNTDNCYHVFYHPSGLGLTTAAVLDGFTIRDGNANGVSPHNSGGGVYNNANSPSLKNCIVMNNEANYGAGLYNESSSPIVINSIIRANYATYNGGGLYNTSSVLVITNCVIFGNAAGAGGGLFSSSNSSPTINNSIVWGNSAKSGHQFYIASGTTTLNNSCYSSSANDLYGTPVNNFSINNNPLFVDPGNGDFRILSTSPCLDSGDDAFNNETYDIRGFGNLRKLSKDNYLMTGTIDMGAYEYQSNQTPSSGGKIIFVDLLATSGLNDGSSWVNAFISLQTALDHAITQDQIWVSKGIYTPSYSYDLPNTSRFYHFRLKSDVQIYGGFAGTETLVSQRTDFGLGGANETILSGDLGILNDVSDNCYQIFYLPLGLGLKNSSILDGVTITGGNANVTSLQNAGGGIYCIGNSPSLINCNISNNRAHYGGAIATSRTGELSVVNSLIHKNSSSYDGGGLYIGNNSSPILTNCIIYENTTLYNGGGIYLASSTSAITINNSIIWANNGTAGKQIYSNTSTSLNYSCYSENSGDISGGLPSIQNCITSDPLLNNPGDQDFRLTASSPCIDAGNDTYCNEPYDIRGIGFPRKLDKDDAGVTGTIDIGAYEFNRDTDCSNPTSGGTIAGDQTFCTSGDPVSFTSSSLPTGHTGTLEYKWQSSTSNSPYSWIDIATSNSTVYDSPALNQTTWYRRLARVDCEADWSGAAASNVLEVTVVALPTVSLGAATGTTCGTTPITVAGNNLGGGATSYSITHNGTGNLAVNGGTRTPFSFSYGPGAGDAGNTVIITVTTNNPGGAPCSPASQNFTLTVFPAPTRTYTSSDITCFGANNGTITVTTTGGTPPYQYSLNNGSTYPYSSPGSPYTIGNLSPGSYLVRVKDSNGCETTFCY